VPRGLRLFLLALVMAVVATMSDTLVWAAWLAVGATWVLAWRQQGSS
jgi:hypothetical protein